MKIRKSLEAQGTLVKPQVSKRASQSSSIGITWGAIRKCGLSLAPILSIRNCGGGALLPCSSKPSWWSPCTLTAIQSVENVCVISCSVWLCDPVDCSLSSSSVRGLIQAGIAEWVASSSCRGSSPPRERICISCFADRFFTAEPPRKLKN